MSVSALQKARYEYKPKLPKTLQLPVEQIAVQKGKATKSIDNHAEVKALFPNTYGKPTVLFTEGAEPVQHRPLHVGVVLSGGQAPGGHNVIAGLFDGLAKAHKDSRLYGFLNGPAGLIKGQYRVLDAHVIDEYRNTGGFDMICSGRTKIETEAQLQSVIKTVQAMHLDALVIIGGDDSNTNAAVLAEKFIQADVKTQVIGVPKTIDGDLKNAMIETSFGFDTATKTYSELIGNIARDAASAKKYWHFIKVMGRSASHIALECALQTQINACLISEEVAEKNMTLQQIVTGLADIIARRAENGENFGVVLIPEGLIEFIPEMKQLFTELNDAMAQHAEEFEACDTFEKQCEWVKDRLSLVASAVFLALPTEIAKELLLDRDPHGNVQVSRIGTEKLIIALVKKDLDLRKEENTYSGNFSSYAHFFGYEGRCAFPSNFDADYCYSLGMTAFLLIAHGLTGYLSSVTNLTANAHDWVAGGVPLTMMMNIEQRHGEQKPVIKKALVDLTGRPFTVFAQNRDEWAITTSYLFPGAIQYWGPEEVCDKPSKTLCYEKEQ